MPIPISRWYLPVPESPIRHNGWPARIQTPLARVWIRPGSTSGLAVKSKSSRQFRAREPGLANQLGLAAVLAFVALHRQQLDQEALVAGLLPGGGLGDPRVVFADGGQPQDPAGLLDRRVRGGVGELVAPGRSVHPRLPSTLVCPTLVCPGRRVSSWS